MEVISRGTKDQVKCGNCDSVMRYAQSDIRLTYRQVFSYHDEIEPEDHYHASITCPICKNTIGVQATRSVKAAIKLSNDRSDHDL